MSNVSTTSVVYNLGVSWHFDTENIRIVCIWYSSKNPYEFLS